MHADLYAAAAGRRSIYSLGRGAGVSDDRILETIRTAVKEAPSSFNSQSARVVVLMGAAHEALWDLTLETLRPLTPAGAFAKTAAKIAGFRAGRGTVLYFEEQGAVRNLQEKFPLYKENFPVWSLQSSGMLQYLVWMMLEAEGLGANLQHYNPLIDAEVARRWQIPAGWKLIAEMPFGSAEAPAGPKDCLPPEERVRVIR